MSTDFTFGYGSNMNWSDLRAWLEANGFDSSLVLTFRPARLNGYEIVWNYYSSRRAGGAANVQPAEGASVYGVLVEFEDVLLKAFDKKEGHPYFYSRERVSVEIIEDGQAVDAWLYSALGNKGKRTDVWPTREYKRIVLNGAEENNLPEEWIQTIKKWPTQD